MKQLASFDLQLGSSHLATVRGSKKRIPVEVLSDAENTTVVLNCECCKELLASRLPGGILIPIASTLKTFFEGRGMRNVDVRVSGDIMRRTYKGTLEPSLMPELRAVLEQAVTHFTKKKRT